MGGKEDVIREFDDEVFIASDKDIVAVSIAGEEV